MPNFHEVLCEMWGMGINMNKVIMTIIFFALCVALVIGVVIPITQQIKDTGQKSFDSVKNMSSNIQPGT